MIKKTPANATFTTSAHLKSVCASKMNTMPKYDKRPVPLSGMVGCLEVGKEIANAYVKRVGYGA